MILVLVTHDTMLVLDCIIFAADRNRNKWIRIEVYTLDYGLSSNVRTAAATGWWDELGSRQEDNGPTETRPVGYEAAVGNATQ